MKYYLILLKRGKVVDVLSYDNEEGRDAQKTLMDGDLPLMNYYGYTEVQTFDADS